VLRIRLDRYVLTEILGPLALGFLVYTFILLLRFLFQSAEMIIRRGLAASVVGKLLLVSLPNIVVLTLPMSLLFGILIAVGRLSSDSELVAMRSCGLSLLALYRPILLLSALFTGLNTLLMLYVLPWGNHSLQQLRLDILTQTMSQQVEARVFYEEWAGKTIYVFETPRPGNRWKGVFLAEAPTGPNVAGQVTTADWGDIIVDQAGERVVLHLTNAFRHAVQLNAPDHYEVSKYVNLDVVLEDQFTSEQRAKISASKGIRELTLRELRKIHGDPAAPAEQRNLAEVEIHKKFSIPMACMVFGLFALPLGINNRRGGKASGFAMSIGVIILYYVMLNNGEEAAHNARMAPWLAMWLPNIVLAAGGIFLLVRRNRDKSLLLGRIDRWVRIELWGRLGELRRRARSHARASGGRDGAADPATAAASAATATPATAATSATAASPPTALKTAGRARRLGATAPKLVLRLPRPRIVFPGILDRYVASLFGRVFVLVLLSGVALYLIFDLSDQFDEILKHKVPAAVLVRYYKYLSLQIFYEISPILVLVTTLLTFILLTRTNEITASKALGMSLYRLALPAVFAALMVTALCGYLEAGVLPAANERVAQAKDRIHGRPTSRSYRRADRQWLFGQGRYIYNYTYYDRQLKTLQRLQVFDFDHDHRLTRRLFTESARYIGDDAWVFSKGWARSFKGAELAGFESFDRPTIVRYPETPAYFDTEIRPPDQMGYRELKEYIQEMRESGAAVPELEVSLYNKIAFPVISFVMSLVALPFAFRIGRQGTLYGIGLSIILGMFFMAIFAFFTKLGEAGALPPLLAVWSPGAVFTLLSMYLFLGVRT
jgi:LPS export ABC transporter permease LptF/LPS export ABC transporter permease LptG